MPSQIQVLGDELIVAGVALLFLRVARRQDKPKSRQGHVNRSRQQLKANQNKGSRRPKASTSKDGNKKKARRGSW